MSSRRSTPNARHIRRSVPNWLIEQRMRAAFGTLEEQRRPARLDRAIDDLRHLEARVDLGGDPHELALSLEERDPLAQVPGRHRAQSTVAPVSRRARAGRPVAHVGVRTAEDDAAERLLLAQHAIDRRTRGARGLRDLLLRERDAAAEDLAELEQPAAHACVGVHVVGLDEELVHAADPLGEDHRERSVDRRALTAQRLERIAVERERLAVGDRLHGRTPPPAGDQGELAERIARADHGEEDARTRRGLDPDAEPAARDEVERVRLVVVVEHDLASRPALPLRDRDELLDVRLRDAGEDLPFHDASVARATQREYGCPPSRHVVINPDEGATR